MSDSRAANAAMDRNRELARQINDEALRDPNSPWSGKFVGIANGQVVALGSDPDEVIDRLEEVEPEPSKCLCFEAGLDYDRVQEIWSVV
jgi:hypothetical protein